MTKVAKIWMGLQQINCIILFYPIVIINKFFFCKLTEQPFLWLPVYTADLLTLACFLYNFGWHLLWINVQNSGLGLEEVPSSYMMYVESYGIHAGSFEINVQFYVGMWLLISFVRLLLGLTVTRQLGPIVSTIQAMFSDVGQFIVIWLFVLLGFSSVGFITF